MSKVNLEIISKLNDGASIIKTIGIKNNDKIIYDENKNIITVFAKDNKIVLTKVTKEYKITINLIEGVSTIGICEYMDKRIPLKIFTTLMKVDNNSIIANYTVEDTDKISYEIKYEVIE